MDDNRNNNDDVRRLEEQVRMLDEQVTTALVVIRQTAWELGHRRSNLELVSPLPMLPLDVEKITGTLPASKESIQSMPTTVIKDTDGGFKSKAGEDCAICLDGFSVGEEVKKMPCNHGFHSGCIVKWLDIHGSCPVCRYVMPPAPDDADIHINNDNGDSDGDGSDQNGRRQRRRTNAISLVFVSLLVA